VNRTNNDGYFIGGNFLLVPPDASASLTWAQNLTAQHLHMIFSWWWLLRELMLCSMVEMNCCYRGSCCLHNQDNTQCHIL